MSCATPATLFVIRHMMNRTQRDLPQPGDYRPESWHDVIGLVLALVGLAFLVAAMM